MIDKKKRKKKEKNHFYATSKKNVIYISSCLISFWPALQNFESMKREHRTPWEKHDAKRDTRIAPFFIETRRRRGEFFADVRDLYHASPEDLVEPTCDGNHRPPALFRSISFRNWSNRSFFRSGGKCSACGPVFRRKKLASIYFRER